jgi:hypothetical protein
MVLKRSQRIRVASSSMESFTDARARSSRRLNSMLAYSYYTAFMGQIDRALSSSLLEVSLNYQMN